MASITTPSEYNTNIRRLIKTVADYTELKASTSDRAIVSDALVGGDFIISADQATATNNVLRILRDDGVIMDRVWDGQNFQVDWIPTGVPIGSLGTIPATYTAEKISYAALLAGDTATLHLTPEAEYVAGIVIVTTNQNVDGHGATIKRGPQISSLLTAESASGTNTVTVADASAFRIGNRVFGVLTAGVVGGHAMATTIGTGYTITNIVGNVITLSSNLVKTCPIGTKLVELDNMFFVHSTTMPPKIRRIVFDGNKAEHSDILDWTTGWALDGYHFDVEGCTFQNHPNESIAISSGSVRTCIFKDCWGSAVHMSVGDDNPAYGLLIENCYAANVDTKNNGHDEGVITFSQKSRNCRVRDCVFDNTGYTRGQGVFGSLAAQSDVDLDGNFQASGVVAKNFASIITISTNGSTSDFDNATFENCVFENCKGMQIGASGTPAKTPFVDRCVVKNCKFLNCWATLRNTRSMSWVDNNMRWDLGGAGVYAGSHATTFASLPSTRIGGTALVSGDWVNLEATDGGNLLGIYIWSGSAWVYSATETDKLPPAGVYGSVVVTDCGRVTITGGNIQGPGCVPRGVFAHGIWMNATAALKTEAGTSTTALMADVLVSNISISGSRYGLTNLNTSHWALPATLNLSGWRYNNVNVWPLRDVNATYINVIGIECWPGCIATACSVYLPTTATGGATNGIILKGPLDATKNIGGIAQNCFVPRTPGGASIRLGMTSDNAANKNCIAINNLVGTAVAQVGTHDKIESGNTIISSATLAGMTAAELPLYRLLGTNSSLY